MKDAVAKTPIYVDALPKSIKTAAGIIVNPTADTCREYGYELTPPEIRQQRLQEQQQLESATEALQQARQNRVVELQNAIAQYRTEFCSTAGIDAADFTPSAAAAAIATASQQRSGAATQIEMLVSALAYTMAVVELLTMHSGVDVAPAPTPEPEQPLRGHEIWRRGADQRHNHHGD